MKLIILIIIYFVWGIIVMPFAASAKPSIVEFTFGSGLIHGTSWLVLLLGKMFGSPIHVFADFHTWGYVAGFLIGCLLFIVLNIILLVRLFISD